MKNYCIHFVVLLIAGYTATPAYSTNYDAQWYFQKDDGFPMPNSTFGSVPATGGGQCLP